MVELERSVLRPSAQGCRTRSGLQLRQCVALSFHPSPLWSIQQVLPFHLSLSQFLVQFDNSRFQALS